LAAGESEIAFAGYCNERAQPSTHCGTPVAVAQRDQRNGSLGYLIERGVVPHFCVVIDAMPHMAERQRCLLPVFDQLRPGPI